MINPVLNVVNPQQGANQKTESGQTPAEFGNILSKKMSENSVKDKTPAHRVPVSQAAEDQPPAPDAASLALAAMLGLSVTTPSIGKTSADTTVPPDAATPATQPTAEPMMTGIAPQTTAVAPQATAVTPQSTNVAPQNAAPSTSGIASSATAPTSQDLRTLAAPKNEALPVGNTLTVNPGKTETKAEVFKLPETPAPTQVNIAPQPVIVTANTQNHIAAPLSSHAWPAEFAQKISWMSTQQSQVAELHLNPPDLGPMSVVLTISDNQATAQFSSPHSAVREAIENAMPRLRESMAENGIMLGNATVNDQPPRDRSEFTSPRKRSESAEPVLTTEAAPLARIAERSHNGMVDTFA